MTTDPSREERADRPRARDELGAQREHLAAELAATRRLQEISLAVVRDDDPSALHRQIVDAAVEIARADFGSMQEYRQGDRGGELRLLASRGLDEDVVRHWATVDVGSACVCGLALRRRERVVVADVRAHPELDAPEHQAAFRRAGIRAVQSTPLVSRSGRVLGMLSTHWRVPRAPADANGHDLRLLDVLARQAADLLDRERTAAELRASNARHEDLIRQVRDYAIFRMDLEGRSTSWNQGVQQVLGFAQDEFLGINVASTIFTPEDVAAGVPEHELEHARRYGVANNDRWMRRKTGERFYAFGVTTALHDERGSVIGFSKVMRDHTARKLAEDALRDAHQRKDQFLAMLAHELRNPLAPIRAAAQVLKILTPAGADSQRAIDVIERQTQHMTRLVDDLLDVSRITHGKVDLQREPVDLATVVQRAVEACRPLIEVRRHRLSVRFPGEPLRVLGDATRLVQVLGNLLHNAAKFTPDGGSIEVVAERDGDAAVVRVRDSGIGIPPNMLGNVFEPFTLVDVSLDRARGGLGIGLTLVRSLLELHGGTVEATSGGPGTGSEFVVRMPALVEGAGPEPRAARPELEASRPLRLLVVEDNVDSADMLAMMLRLEGHEVQVAHDAREALEGVASFVPEVVLCDVGLPGTDGYELAGKLRRRPELRHTVLLALTGYGQDEDRTRARAAGFAHHLVKPVEPDTLAALLRAVASHGAV